MASMLHLFLLLGSFMVASAGNLNQDFDITWGDGRAKILNNGELLTLSLDKASGSGFQSRNEYLFGKIDMPLKLVPGNSARTVTLSSIRSTWDEIDFERLGNLSGDPYIRQTNVFSRRKGNRELQFYLCYFHTYSILWNPQRIVQLLCGWHSHKRVQEPRIKFHFLRINQSEYTPLWNVDDWATRGRLVKTDWTQAPFTASYRNFKAEACVWLNGESSCSPSSTSSSGTWLSQEVDSTSQNRLKWVQKNDMIYNHYNDTDFPRAARPNPEPPSPKSTHT